MSRYFIGILFVLTILLPQYGQAQFTNISLNVSDVRPEPGQTVQFSLSGSLLGNQNRVQWYVNGIEQNEWRGTISPSLTINNLERRTIEARIEGQVIARSIINPVYIDIVVEPQTYIPPHYTGRPLPSSGSNVRLVALVEEAGAHNASQYNYTWRVDGRTVDAVAGQNTLVITMPSNSSQVDLTVRRGDIIVGEQRFTLPAVQPTLIFYTVHPLYGLQDRGFQNSYTFNNSTVSLEAAPFYIPTQAVSSLAETEIQWRVNGLEISSDADNRLRTTIQRGNVTNGSLLRFNLFNPAAWQQQAQGTLRFEL